MRRFLLITPFLLIGLACLGIVFTAWFVASAYYLPGQALFPLQETVEELRLRLMAEPSNKVDYTLELLELRMADLTLLADTPSEVAALQALDKSLERAQKISADIPAELKPDLMRRLAEILERAANLLSSLSIAPKETPDFYLAVITRVLSMHELAAGFNSSGSQIPDEAQVVAMLPLILQSNGAPAPEAGKDIRIEPQAVIFPPGSPGAQHTFFPLTGAHSTLECEGCHQDGKFVGTARLCSACHVQVKPASHFPGECSACHSTSGWLPASFNHAGQTNCQSCHTRPGGHYTGQCSMCHTTNAWLPARFNHAGQTNCQSCHTRPNGHYTGQCSMCHSSDAWLPARFNHAGQTNCQSCHTPPNGHYTGQCSACHSTSAWRPASFDHTGQTDCQSCHARPNGHYTGQCSSCHSTNAWRPASFDHSGQTNCQSCHTRPNGHFSGQCSQCHNTSSWGNASFNHNGLTDCQSCHTRPNGHYSGQCSDCHTTNSWGNIQMRGHRFPIDHKNADGVCSRCHPSGGRGYTCYNCHDRARMENKHAEKNIFDIASRCADCHPDGKND